VPARSRIQLNHGTPRDRGTALAKRTRLDWGNQDLPISGLFDEIQSRTSIWVVRRPLEADIDGAIFGSSDSRVMVINTRERALGKQRATAAHELGHHLEDETQDFAETIAARPSAGEAFAEGFATELLMPRDGVVNWVATSVGEGDSIEARHVAQLSAYFRASYEMAVIRLEVLQYITRPRGDELLTLAGRRAAYEGGVEEWYDQNLVAMNAFELPAVYISSARTAYAEGLISLDRLAELEFLPVDVVRQRMKERGLLVGETEDEADETSRTRNST
jgi:Zn-dependent peptidase ImmA (M78 family)